jgi:oligoribonuclease (3'-5' exoribonuclease)
MKYFMLDIESMGVDFESDDIIQIALLELTKDSNGYYVAGRSFLRTLHTSQKPKNDWIAKTHKDLLPICLNTPRTTPTKVRTEILRFFKECGVDGPAMIMGLNATTFDVPYMVNKGYFQKPKQDVNNKLVGDYHYRIYELKGAYNLAQDVLNIDDKELKTLSNFYNPFPDQDIPGKPHEALYDCYRQTQTLNGIISAMKHIIGDISSATNS